MYKYGLVLSAVVLLAGAGAALAQNADTVDGFHAYGTPTANALLALNGSARMSGAVIADNSIPGSRLVPGAVTAGRLGNNSVTTEKISDGQVMSADLAAGAVTQSKIANNSVTNTKIKDGTILGEDLSVPVVMGGNRDGYLIGCFNANTGNSTSGITGFSTATSGYTRGVVGACQSPNGKGVYGISKSATGYTYGVFGEAHSENGCGVYGYSSHMSGFAHGVMGHINSTDGRAVEGYAGTSAGSSIGVFGQSNGSSGCGVVGYAQATSGTNYGVYGETLSSNGYGIYTYGDGYVEGDFTVTGTKTGYVSDIVLNAGDEPLCPGELVEIVWHAEPVVGKIPVAVVRQTCEASSKAVLGPVDSAVSITPNEKQAEPAAPGRPRAQYHVKRADGAVLPGEYGRVVTLGLFECIRVDASYGPIYPGDLLVSSPTPGCAMACDDPKVGTVVGKALGALEFGIGEIPVFVSPR